MDGEVAQVPRVLRGRAGLAIRLSLPLAALVGLIVSILVVFPVRSTEFYGLLATYIIPPAGKETVIPAAVASGFSPFLVAVYIAGVDMTLGWVMAWNWDLIVSVPKVGEGIERLMHRGQAWMEDQPIVDRSAFMGLILFVFFPMQGSGAIAGVTVGRLIGMPAQRAWLAIMIGALTAAFAWAYAAGAIRVAVVTFGIGFVARWALVLLASAVFVGLLMRRIYE